MEQAGHTTTYVLLSVSKIKGCKNIQLNMNCHFLRLDDKVVYLKQLLSFCVAKDSCVAGATPGPGGQGDVVGRHWRLFSALMRGVVRAGNTGLSSHWDSQQGFPPRGTKTGHMSYHSQLRLFRSAGPVGNRSAIREKPFRKLADLAGQQRGSVLSSQDWADRAATHAIQAFPPFPVSNLTWTLKRNDFCHKDWFWPLETFNQTLVISW